MSKVVRIDTQGGTAAEVSYTVGKAVGLMLNGRQAGQQRWKFAIALEPFTDDGKSLGVGCSTNVPLEEARALLLESANYIILEQRGTMS